MSEGFWASNGPTFSRGLRRLRPNAFSVSSLLSACEACGEWQRALSIYGREALHVEGNAVVLGAAMAACARGAAWREALQLFERMETESVGRLSDARPSNTCSVHVH